MAQEPAFSRVSWEVEMAEAREFKTKKLEAGKYEVVGTRLVISKGDPPKFGMTQMWDVHLMDGSDWGRWLFEARGKDHARDILERLAAEFGE
jgi:hypothetical protein